MAAAAAAAATSSADEFEEESISKWEAIRLKTLADQTYTNSSNDLKSALKYAKRAHRLCPTLHGVSETLTAFKILTAAAESATTPHWYKILDLEPFSHINSIKKQYENLTLVLHPDKNPNTSVATEAAFKLVAEAFSVLNDKIRRQEYDMKLRISMHGAVTVEAFWTVCLSCRWLHQFERRYLGNKLLCPNCKRGFVAVEVEYGEKVRTDDERVLSRRESKRKMSSVGDIMRRSELAKESGGMNGAVSKRRKAGNNGKLKENGKMIDYDYDYDYDDGDDDDGDDEEMMTLAEMQRSVKANVNVSKSKVNEKDKIKRSGSTSSKSKNQNLDAMTVEDSDFYDFDEGRVEKSFKKGQIWALYDDDDGMPRHYGLIDEVVSTKPFQVNMSWLEPQVNGDDALTSLEKTGFHISCGRFKVSTKTSVASLNVFSHIVNCERAAREVYRIYPKKGSVWALYNQLDRDKRRYDIVVFLTSYSEVHGLSMAYLEKVSGLKTTFRRREMGCHAIKWLEKHEARLFSHQIPARKLSQEEVPSLSGDCWELDPASLPTEMSKT
ncbi:uncharacterized protein LOC143568819 [Bidens hawaiensis]|uniref:uncharacterized protein LOC143568819 n=1 Tax=Bidens hawaiensis TaxID=980011 RepID=UPI004049F4F3